MPATTLRERREKSHCYARAPQSNFPLLTLPSVSLRGAGLASLLFVQPCPAIFYTTSAIALAIYTFLAGLYRASPPCSDTPYSQISFIGCCTYKCKHASLGRHPCLANFTFIFKRFSSFHYNFLFLFFRLWLFPPPLTTEQRDAVD